MDGWWKDRRKHGAGGRRPGRNARRVLGVERLEDRRLMVAEGEVFSLSRTIDARGLVGPLSATVTWGDGTTTAATVEGGEAVDRLRARIDYSLDSSGFFTSARRQLLQAAIDAVLERLGDTLTAISPSGSNTWTASFLHPSTGRTVERANLSIAQNEILVFAGARSMPGPQLGVGGPGGFSARGTSDFLTTVQTRGQGNVSGSNANDFGPWGGSLAFDSSATWHFGTSTDGLGPGEYDFVTTAMHEFMHLLGFGTSASWQRLVSASGFTGPRSVAAYDGSGNVPLASGGSHWAKDLEDAGAEVLMDADYAAAIRKMPTPLDFAALDDIGWQIPAANARITATHVYADNGRYPVEVTLVGGRLGEKSVALSTTITNVAPTVTIADDQTVVAGQRLNVTDLAIISDPGFRNTAADPDTHETFTYSIDWGDGSTPQSGTATIDRIGNATRTTLASFNGNHTYATSGTYTVRVTVADDDGGRTSQTMRVVVLEPPRLSLESNRQRLVEDGSVRATLTVRRSGGILAEPLLVTLASSDTTEATVPATVTIPAGAASATVTVQPRDDDLLDGDQEVRVTAEAPGIEPAAVDLVVADAESLMALFLDPEISEGAGADAARLRITRSNTDTASPLVVTIGGGDATELERITRATIPAGQRSVVLALDVMDDELYDRTQEVTVNVSAPGYMGSSATVSILDDEPPRFQNPDNPLDVNADGEVRPIDALRIINYLNRQGGPQTLDPDSDPPPPPYLDVNGDYQVSPLDALRVINAINRGVPPT